MPAASDPVLQKFLLNALKIQSFYQLLYSEVSTIHAKVTCKKIKMKSSMKNNGKKSMIYVSDNNGSKHLLKVYCMLGTVVVYIHED